MPVDRIHWDYLPAQARRAVEQHTGPIERAETAAAGANSGIAATLHTATGNLFVEGVPSEHPQARTQQREADIAPTCPPPAPACCGAYRQRAGTSSATNAHQPPRRLLPRVPRPAPHRQRSRRAPEHTLPEHRTQQHAEQRWAPYLPSPELFAGHTLLHTDLAPHNVLITDRAHLIEWAWPTRGAAWIDPTVLIPRLMEAGHTARQADQWARVNLPSWPIAPPAPVTAFSAANAAFWKEIAHSDGQVWKKNMARHAHDWLTYWQPKFLPAGSCHSLTVMSHAGPPDTGRESPAVPTCDQPGSPLSAHGEQARSRPGPRIAWLRTATRCRSRFRKARCTPIRSYGVVPSVVYQRRSATVRTCP